MASETALSALLYENEGRFEKDNTFAEIYQDVQMTDRIDNKTSYFDGQVLAPCSCLAKATVIMEEDSICFRNFLAKQQFRFDETTNPVIIEKTLGRSCSFCFQNSPPSVVDHGKQVQYCSTLECECSRSQKPIGHNNGIANQSYLNSGFNKLFTNFPCLYITSERHHSSPNSVSVTKNCDTPKSALLQTWKFSRLCLAVLLFSSFTLAAETESTNILPSAGIPCRQVLPSTFIVYERHPTNCSIFYMCYGSKYWEKTCTEESTIFSMKHRVCVWKNSILDDCPHSSIKIPNISIGEDEHEHKITISHAINNTQIEVTKNPDDTLQIKKLYRANQEGTDTWKSQKKVTEFVTTNLDNNYVPNDVMSDKDYKNTQAKDQDLPVTNRYVLNGKLRTQDRRYRFPNITFETEFQRKTQTLQNNVLEPERMNMINEHTEDHHISNGADRTVEDDYGDNSISMDDADGDDYDDSSNESEEESHNNIQQMSNDENVPKIIQILHDDEVAGKATYSSQSDENADWTTLTTNELTERTVYPTANVDITDQPMKNKNGYSLQWSLSGRHSREPIKNVDYRKFDGIDPSVNEDFENDSNKRTFMATHESLLDSTSPDLILGSPKFPKDLNENQNSDEQEGDEEMKSLNYPSSEEEKYLLRQEQNTPDLIVDEKPTSEQRDTKTPQPTTLDPFGKSWLKGPYHERANPEGGKIFSVLDSVLRPTQTDVRNYSIDTHSNDPRFLNKTTDINKFRRRFFTTPNKDFDKRDKSNGSGLNRDKTNNNIDRSYEQRELKQESHMIRNENTWSLQKPLPTHTFYKNHTTNTVPDDRTSKYNEIWYTNNNNMDRHNNKEEITPSQIFSETVTKPIPRRTPDNFDTSRSHLTVQPWPALQKKLSKLSDNTRLPLQLFRKAVKPLKAADNPLLMKQFMQLINATIHQKNDTLTIRANDSRSIKGQKVKYTRDNLIGHPRNKSGSFWLTEKRQQEVSSNFQGKSIMESPLLKRHETGSPSPQKFPLRDNEEKNTLLPDGKDKYGDEETTKPNRRFNVNRSMLRSTLRGQVKQPQQNQHSSPQVEQRQHFQRPQEQNQLFLQQHEQTEQHPRQRHQFLPHSQQNESYTQLHQRPEQKRHQQEDTRSTNPTHLQNNTPHPPLISLKRVIISPEKPTRNSSDPPSKQTISKHSLFRKLPQQNTQSEHADYRYHQHFHNMKIVKKPGLQILDRTRSFNMNRFRKQPKFGHKKMNLKNINNKLNGDDLINNIKSPQKVQLIKQKYLYLNTKRNRTSVKRPELKRKTIPTFYTESDAEVNISNQNWAKDSKISFEAQPGPADPVLSSTTATTMITKTSTFTTTSTKATTRVPQVTTTSRYEERKVTFLDDTDYVPVYRQNLKERCGVLSTPLIIGGKRTAYGQWPWQVSLQIVSSTTPWHRCGGVLVHPRWVLTAAHCMEGSFYGEASNWRVVIADYDLESVSGSEIYRDIVRIISHPGYIRTSNFPNDVALLELDSPVDLTSGDVQTACLPDFDFPLIPNTRCWISGWGETRGTGGQENMMNEVSVEVLPHEQCKSMWGKVNIDVLDSQVCLGYGQTGACYGDSGGPLMCESDGRFFVAGVMSWLINNCSANNFPNVFTRLPHYMDWVHSELDYFEWLRHL